ncbi:class A rhodopsin-like G-protein coupled receptor GPRnna13, putative [Pediculus humanus corporis]|uniref:Class A rhodopsin-like G-protein coupled receptor GPRnna13, putative n=1 Tax=Pediculus humanus subsp. corporis TaxID=121224 RepID=E0VKP7_PEDHC|nr:class A rhodopsin-like G-protein coupled receptor GPRnna13, putative [Pediculus humanus corporis]EEB13953.1 class A rhodopsin-like G-protein coupled receptor GPRnna13, putative [Pediculus humanus corporis]
MEIWNLTATKNASVQNKTMLYGLFLNESRFWIQRVLLPIVVIIGFAGNALTVVVLTHRRMRNSTHTYLTALAISDLLYLVFVFTLSLEHYPGSHTKSFYYYWKFYRFGLWLTDASTCVSTWLTVTFTVERYIAVCHPIKGKIICTEARARIAIVLIYIFCFLSTVTTPLEWQLDVREIIVNQSKVISYVGQMPSELGVDINYTTTFYWFWSITFVFLPLLLLGIFNSFLIVTVHRSRNNRRKMTQTKHNNNNSQRQENKITVTLIAVVILFLFCQLPTAVLLIIKSVHIPPDDSNTDKIFRILGNIFNFLVTINAASNFLLYCAFSANYRRTLIGIFCKKRRRTSLFFQSTIIPESSVSKSIGQKQAFFNAQASTKSASFKDFNSGFKSRPSISKVRETLVRKITSCKISTLFKDKKTPVSLTLGLMAY